MTEILCSGYCRSRKAKIQMRQHGQGQYALYDVYVLGYGVIAQGNYAFAEQVYWSEIYI